MSTVFAKIIRGEIPCHRLCEDDRFLSFLDVRPVADGHALVIPKMEVDRFFDMDAELLAFSALPNPSQKPLRPLCPVSGWA